MPHYEVVSATHRDPKEAARLLSVDVTARLHDGWAIMGPMTVTSAGGDVTLFQVMVHTPPAHTAQGESPQSAQRGGPYLN